MSPYCGTAQLIMKRNLSGRIAVLVIGLWIMSLGIAFSIAAGLGTSPISSLPYTLSMLTPLTVGTATIMLHVILITLQALILRHRYRPIQLLQLPLAVLFGLLTDASNAMLGFLSPSSYLGSWLFCLIGMILVAAGVSAEELFRTMKVSVDCPIVASSLILSFTFLRRWGGVREGTIAAAPLVGTAARIFNKVLLPIKTKYFA